MFDCNYKKEEKSSDKKKEAGGPEKQVIYFVSFVRLNLWNICFLTIFGLPFFSQLKASVDNVPSNQFCALHFVLNQLASQNTHPPAVSKEEVDKLLYTYRAIAGDPNARIDRITFRDLLQDHFHMSDDFFMDRVFRAFDKDSDGYLSHEEWVVGLSTFIKGDLDSAIKCKYWLYTHDHGYCCVLLAITLVLLVH